MANNTRLRQRDNTQMIRRGKTHILIPDKEPMTYIPLSDCRHGWLYKIKSRNLIMGVFCEDKKGFVGIREKFDQRFLFVEYHWDTGPPFGTVKPLECLEPCPIQNLDEDIEIDGKRVENEELFQYLKDIGGVPPPSAGWQKHLENLRLLEKIQERQAKKQLKKRIRGKPRS